MNCPNCGAPNDPSSKFCASCGHPLQGQGSSSSSDSYEPAYSPRAVLGIQTGQLLLSLLGLWILRTVLTGLSFVQELRIPDVPMTTPSIISALIYLTIIVLLVRYVSLLGRLWPQAFPGYPHAAAVGGGIVYLIALAQAYKGSKPLLAMTSADPELVMIWQIVLVFIALLVAIRVSVIVYRFLPTWLTSARRSLLDIPMPYPSREEREDSS